MIAPFEIEAYEHSARVTVLRVRGTLDARSASQLVTRASAVRTEGRHLVLNLAGVGFMSSSGIGALLALVEEFRLAPTTMRLCEVPSSVESVIRLLNLGRFLVQYPDEDSACSALEAA